MTAYFCFLYLISESQWNCTRPKINMIRSDTVSNILDFALHPTVSLEHLQDECVDQITSHYSSGRNSRNHIHFYYRGNFVSLHQALDPTFDPTE